MAILIQTNLPVTPPNFQHVPKPTARSRNIRHKLPAVLMRAGTSKGLFIQRKHLPPLEEDWEAPLLAAMGSSLADSRQIDGVGGATSTTSKVAVVGPSQIPGVDVDYTFVQVAVGKNSIDLSGSCGNMASGVGPFALQEGLVNPPAPGQATMDVRIFNTNTSRLMVETLQLTEDGEFQENGDYVIAGAKGSGSEVKMGFIDPAGSMTSRLFPTTNTTDRLSVERPDRLGSYFSVIATLIDVANPFVLVDEASLPPEVKQLDSSSDIFGAYAEAIRCAGSVKMGLAESIESASTVRGTPKLAMVLDPVVGNNEPADVKVQAFSMGKPHPTLQITGAVCIASAVCLPETVPSLINSRRASLGMGGLLTPMRDMSPELDVERVEESSSKVARIVTVAHPSGTINVEVITVQCENGDMAVERCIVSRTARRIFEGKVMYYLPEQTNYHIV